MCLGGAFHGHFPLLAGRLEIIFFFGHGCVEITREGLLCGLTNLVAADGDDTMAARHLDEVICWVSSRLELSQGRITQDG